MTQIQVTHNLGGIDGLCLIVPTVHEDERGYFMETFNLREMKENGLDYNFVQHNQSCSHKGVLRGLHYQKNYPQTKLVRVVKGEVFDVAVDLRKDSATYGKWYGVLLSAANKHQFLIPKGFAHGFVVLSDIAEFCYMCDDYWHPNDEGGIAWNDPDLCILWPRVEGLYKWSASCEGYSIDGFRLIVSEKDEKWLPLKETEF